MLDTVSFPFYERKASNEVRNRTFGNIDESKDIPEKVQMCVCEVAELLLAQEKREKKSEIASEKSGNYSVSYQKQTAGEKHAEIRNVIVSWLSDTGYLYCGVM